jgi:hypothetical protein
MILNILVIVLSVVVGLGMVHKTYDTAQELLARVKGNKNKKNQPTTPSPTPSATSTPAAASTTTQSNNAAGVTSSSLDLLAAEAGRNISDVDDYDEKTNGNATSGGSNDATESKKRATITTKGPTPTRATHADIELSVV